MNLQKKQYCNYGKKRNIQYHSMLLANNVLFQSNHDKPLKK